MKIQMKHGKVQTSIGQQECVERNKVTGLMSPGLKSFRQKISLRREITRSKCPLFR